MTKTNTAKKIMIPAIIIVLVLAIICFLWQFGKGEAWELSMDICSDGWEGNITYSMLSGELKEIVTEDEFNDSSPEGRIAMYRKLESLVLDDRPAGEFDGSTDFWKSPCVDEIEIGDMDYYVNIEIDLDSYFFDSEVVNFTCHIYEFEEKV